MALNVGVLAYLMVILNTLVLTPFVLYALGFSGRGMDWAHGALFAAMLAPTDAVSVTALLKAGWCVDGWGLRGCRGIRNCDGRLQGPRPVGGA